MTDDQEKTHVWEGIIHDPTLDSGTWTLWMDDGDAEGVGHFLQTHFNEGDRVRITVEEVAHDGRLEAIAWAWDMAADRSMTLDEAAEAIRRARGDDVE